MMNHFLTLLLSLFIMFPLQLHASPAGGELALFYSNNMHGETEPCG